jgi:hypothetical protein
MTATAAETAPEGHRDALRSSAEAMSALVEQMCVQTLGRGYGGKGLLALSLRPSAESPEALFVVVPALAAGETERTFRPPQILAEYLSPLDRVEASLDGGRVHLRRLEGGGREIEVFLVLRPKEASAPYERLQIVSRLQTGSPR